MSTVESKFASFQLVGKVANPKCTYALTVDSAEDAKAESPDNSVIKASYSLLLKSTESAKFFERVFGELMAGFEALSPYVFNKCSVDVQDTVLTATLRINVRDVYAKFVEQAEKIFNDIKGAEVVFKFGSTLDDYVDPARDVKDLLQAEVTINGQPALVDKAVEFTVKHVNRSLQRANDKWELTPATADDGSTVINSEQILNSFLEGLGLPLFDAGGNALPLGAILDMFAPKVGELLIAASRQQNPDVPASTLATVQLVQMLVAAQTIKRDVVQILGSEIVLPSGGRLTTKINNGCTSEALAKTLVGGAKIYLDVLSSGATPRVQLA